MATAFRPRCRCAGPGGAAVLALAVPLCWPWRCRCAGPGGAAVLALAVPLCWPWRCRCAGPGGAAVLALAVPLCWPWRCRCAGPGGAAVLALAVPLCWPWRCRGVPRRGCRCACLVAPLGLPPACRCAAPAARRGRAQPACRPANVEKSRSRLTSGEMGNIALSVHPVQLCRVSSDLVLYAQWLSIRRYAHCGSTGRLTGRGGPARPAICAVRSAAAKGTRTAAEGEATCGYFNWVIFVPAGK